MVYHILKLLQQMLQDFFNVSEHFLSLTYLPSHSLTYNLQFECSIGATKNQ